MDPGDILYLQWPDMIRISGSQPFEAVIDADDLDSVVDRLDGHRADHSVDPRCGSAGVP